MSLLNINKSGFVILYAVLMVSIVLTVSLSLLNITYKQLIISVTGYDSRLADAVAISTLRCMLLWDKLLPPIDPNPLTGLQPTSDYFPFGRFDPRAPGGYYPDAGASLKCGGTLVTGATLGDGPIYEFEIDYTLSNGNLACAKVTVEKDPVNLKTDIESRGYNLPCNSTSLRKVERAYHTF